MPISPRRARSNLKVYVAATSNSSYHDTRLQYDPKRRVLWQTLCDAYFRKLISPEYHVLELGAGYGDFINSVTCAKRTAIDQFPQLPKYLQAGVVGRIGSVTIRISAGSLGGFYLRQQPVRTLVAE